MPVEIVDLEEQLRRAITLTESHPLDPAAWRKHAEALQDLGRGKDASEAARRAIELAPDDAWGHYLLGRILAQVGRNAEAAWFLSTAATRAPGTPALAMDRALALEAGGRSREACEELQRTIALDPMRADPHTLLARLLLDQGDAEAALDHVRAAALLEPASADAHVRLAYVFERTGRSAEAKRCCAVAAALDGTVFARLGLGHALDLPLRIAGESLDRPRQ
jgi:tetratricopeptide (TPR) repeat protein